MDNAKQSAHLGRLVFGRLLIGRHQAGGGDFWRENLCLQRFRRNVDGANRITQQHCQLVFRRIIWQTAASWSPWSRAAAFIPIQAQAGRRPARAVSIGLASPPRQTAVSWRRWFWAAAFIFPAISVRVGRYKRMRPPVSTGFPSPHQPMVVNWPRRSLAAAFLFFGQFRSDVGAPNQRAGQCQLAGHRLVRRRQPIGGNHNQQQRPARSAGRHLSFARHGANLEHDGNQRLYHRRAGLGGGTAIHRRMASSCRSVREQSGRELMFVKFENRLNDLEVWRMSTKKFKLQHSGSKNTLGFSKTIFSITSPRYPRLFISNAVFGTASGSLTPQSHALFIQMRSLP